MSFTVALEAVPNQTLTVVLDGAIYDISIQAMDDEMMAVSIARDGTQLVTNLRAVADFPLLPYSHMEQGNFIFLTDNQEFPFYEKFNVSQSLVFFTAAELVTIRGGA